MLVDGTAQLYRAYFAVRGLSTSRGLPTNAIFGFTAMLRKLLKDERPDMIAVAFDLPGEVIPHHEFYSYEAKYIDEEGAGLEIPARLSDTLVREARELAIRSFQTLCCEGMARVDLFLTPDERFIMNEINTIPGFTRISMYPKLFDASGISYPDLIDKLVKLAIARHERQQGLKTSR